MNETEVIIFLTEALAFGAWAAITEMRLRQVQSQLTASEEKNKDAQIAIKTHALSDAELTALVSDSLGGPKPGA